MNNPDEQAFDEEDLSGQNVEDLEEEYDRMMARRQELLDTGHEDAAEDLMNYIRKLMDAIEEAE